MVLFFHFKRRYQIKNSIKYMQHDENQNSLLKNQGLKPYIFSKKKYLTTGIDWQQNGINVHFQQKKLRYNFVYQKIKVRPLLKLSFEYEFQYENDVVYFAYSIPYTYSQLLKEISDLKGNNSQSDQIIQISNNGYTLMGLPIPVVKITDPKVELQNKKIIFATGRIHPGESNGSIAMSGFLQFLCSKEGQYLRKHVIFIIVPMINPDGVILGNSRTSILGKDLNRQYYYPSQDLFPQIANIRSLVQNILKQKQIYMFLDFHGHSQKKNAFAYGPPYNITDSQYCKSKIFPKLISMTTQMFRYYSCVFSISQSKKFTARAIMFSEYNIPYTYTIQISNGFFYDSKLLRLVQFNRQKWLQLGKKIGLAYSDYFIYLMNYEQLLIKRREIKLNQKLKLKSNQQRRILYNRTKKIYTMKQNGQQLPPIKQSKKNQKSTIFLSMIQEITEENFQKHIKEDQEYSQSDSQDERNQMDDLKMNELKRIIKACKAQQISRKNFNFQISTQKLKLKSKKIKYKKKISKIQQILKKQSGKTVKTQINMFDQLKKSNNIFQKKNKQQDNLFSISNYKSLKKKDFLDCIDPQVIQEVHKSKNVYIADIKNSKISNANETDKYFQMKTQFNSRDQFTQYPKNYILYTSSQTQKLQQKLINRRKKLERNKKYRKKSIKILMNQSEKARSPDFKQIKQLNKSHDNNQSKQEISLNIFKQENSNSLKINFTKLIGMINSQTIENKKQQNRSIQSVSSKGLFPKSFYQVNQQIKMRKNLNIIKELTKFQKNLPADYLQIKKYQ